MKYVLFLCVVCGIVWKVSSQSDIGSASTGPHAGGSAGPGKAQTAQNPEKTNKAEDVSTQVVQTDVKTVPVRNNFVQYYNTRDVPFRRNVSAIPLITYKTCLLIPDKGPCRANLDMFYFYPANKTCQKFRWGGCQGNGNRFDSERECRDYCLVNSNAKSVAPYYCKLAFDYGYCFGSTNRWYYDKTWKVCKKSIYSGCGGNKNNFYSREQCDSICRFGKHPLKIGGDSDSKLKFLVVNPLDATTKRE